MSKQTTLDAVLAELQKIRKALEKDSGKTFEQHFNTGGSVYEDAVRFNRPHWTSSYPSLASEIFTVANNSGRKEHIFNEKQFDRLRDQVPRSLSRFTPREGNPPECSVIVGRELWDHGLSRYERTTFNYCVRIRPSDRPRTDLVGACLLNGELRFRVTENVSPDTPIYNDQFKVHLPRNTATITQSMIEALSEGEQ